MHIREGRFQRSLSLMAGGVQHPGRTGGFLRALQGKLRSKGHVDAGGSEWSHDGRGHLGLFQQMGGAQTVLRWVSVVTLLDSLVGFFFHVRGIARVSRAAGGFR
jgi:hypothetical protein